ncbi:MAG: flagellar hook-basal body complex protein FliE [Desulfovibrio sp.]
MIVKSAALQAYQKAQRQFSTQENKLSMTKTSAQEPTTSFSDTLTNSVQKVNELQSEKKQMVLDFASGKEQNVHEMMISMQKASVAMSMTSAVRSKVLSAYQEIMRMPF